MQNFKTYFFTDDGNIPNNILPVIYYPAVSINKDLGCWFEKKFQETNWGNNWRDIVLPYDHFHSTTHEVLALCEGDVTLKVGGINGILLHILPGDVLIIPAGVGHCAVSNQTDYQFMGGYPNGLDWDLRRGLLTERQEVLTNISQVKLPETDPIYGKKGGLLELWQVSEDRQKHH